MHFIFEPLPRVLLAVRPIVFPDPTYFIFVEFALVVALLGENKFASPMLPSFIILALIFCTVWPAFLSETMLLILKPLTLVLCTIHMRVSSLAMRLIIQPFPLVCVTVSMIQLTVSGSTVLFIVAFIAGAIGPLLDTETVPCAPHPLSSVHTPIRKCDSWFLDARSFIHANLLFSFLFRCAACLKVVVKHSLISHLDSIQIILRIQLGHLKMRITFLSRVVNVHLLI